MALEDKTRLDIWMVLVFSALSLGLNTITLSSLSLLRLLSKKEIVEPLLYISN